MDKFKQNKDHNNIKVETQVVSTSNNHKALNKNRFLYLLGVLVVLFLGIGIIFYTNDKFFSADKTATIACSDRNESAILSKAKKIFKSSEDVVTIEKIESLVKEIKMIENYEEDSNCIYPIIFSYILENDFVSAKSEFDKFILIYGDGDNFAKDIYPMQNIDDLKSLIDFSLEIQSNDSIVPTPDNVVGAGEQVRVIPESELDR